MKRNSSIYFGEKKIMIDWLKVEARPEVKQKVEGRFLLDLRTKVNSLERQLTQKKIDLEKVFNDLESTSNDLQVAKDTLTSKDEKIVELNETFAETKKELTEAIAIKDKGISDLKTLNSDLIAKVSELEDVIKEKESKISSLDQQIIEKDEKIESTKAEFMRKFFDKNEELENTREKLEQEIASKDEDIANKNNEINDMIADLEQKIAQKDVEIANWINQLQEKDNQIENLKGDIKADSYDLEQLSKQNQALVERISEAEEALGLFQQMKEIMEHKGFISDKEFEKLKK